MTARRWDSADAILSSSEKIRDELAAAAAKLDSYIEQLKIAMEPQSEPVVEDGDT